MHMEVSNGAIPQVRLKDQPFDFFIESSLYIMKETGINLRILESRGFIASVFN